MADFDKDFQELEEAIKPFEELLDDFITAIYERLS